MESYLATYGSTKTEKESNTFSGSVSSGSLQVKNNWKCDSQELFERKLIDYFVLHYSRKGFFRKGFEPEINFVAFMVI